MLAPDFRIVLTSGKKIGQLLVKKKLKEVDLDSVVYKMPCGGCNRSYYGETGRGLKKTCTRTQK